MSSLSPTAGSRDHFEQSGSPGTSPRGHLEQFAALGRLERAPQAEQVAASLLSWSALSSSSLWCCFGGKPLYNFLHVHAMTGGGGGGGGWGRGRGRRGRRRGMQFCEFVILPILPKWMTRFTEINNTTLGDACDNILPSIVWRHLYKSVSLNLASHSSPPAWVATRSRPPAWVSTLI